MKLANRFPWCMLQEALGYIAKTAPFGIGVGEWPNVSRSGVDYPHNEHLEILVESGVPGFLCTLFLFPICYFVREVK